MASVLFINPVVREEDEPRHVPYGMALIAAIAMKEGHQVQVYDANAWRAGDQVLEQVLTAHPWDVIALGGITTAYRSIKHVLQMARRVAPKSLTVLGGGVLTSIPKEMVDILPWLDVGVVGEAFITFSEILKILDEGKRDFSGVAGVVYRHPEQGIRLTPPRTLIDDLDQLPYPAWELFPLDIYFKNSMALFSEEGMLAQRRLDINASYGCSLICRYCFHLGISGDMEYVEGEHGLDVTFTWKRTIRYHSPRYIVDLVKYAHKTYNVDFIGFLDENLITMHQFSGRKWMTEICKLWIEEGLQPTCIRDGVPHDQNCKGIHWSGTSHATLCNPEVLKLMRQAGCSHLVYGYESFNKRVMKTIGKGATPKNNRQSLEWTIDAGIRPIPNVILGFPDEDFDSIHDNIIACRDLGIRSRPHFATPYPGSEWFQVYRKSILEQYEGNLEAFIEDLGDASRVTAVISKKFNAVELYGLREIMVDMNLRRLKEYEQIWDKLHPDGIRFTRPPVVTSSPVEAPVTSAPGDSPTTHG